MLSSEADKQSEINRAEGQKQRVILESEAAMLDSVNRAKGEAEAILARAHATASSVEALAAAIGSANGTAAVQMRVAEQYIEAFGRIAKAGTTVLLPSGVADPASMVAQALSVYQATGGAGGGRGAAEVRDSGCRFSDPRPKLIPRGCFGGAATRGVLTCPPSPPGPSPGRLGEAHWGGGRRRRRSLGGQRAGARVRGVGALAAEGSRRFARELRSASGQESAQGGATRRQGRVMEDVSCVQQPPAIVSSRTSDDLLLL